MGANSSTVAGPTRPTDDLSTIHDLCEARDFDNLKAILKADPELYPTTLKCACRTNFTTFFARFDELQPDDGVFVIPKSDIEDITDPQTADLALKIHRSKTPLCKHAETLVRAVNERDFDRAVKLLRSPVSDDSPELEAELWIEFVRRNVFNRLVRSDVASPLIGSKVAQLRLQMAALKFSDKRIAQFLLDNYETPHSFRVACAQNTTLCDLVCEDVSEQEALNDHAQELIRVCMLEHGDYQLKRVEQLLTKTSPNVCGGKALMVACERGDVALLQLLISDPRTDVNIADDLALKIVLSNQHIEAVNALMATGKFTLSARQRQMLESMQIIQVIRDEEVSERGARDEPLLRRRTSSARSHILASSK